MRTAEIKRVTKETKICLSLNLDGTGQSHIDTGVGFMDHMLTLFAAHSRCDLDIKCDGDTYVDDHHTVEDIAICLGQAIDQALGEKRGISRYSSTIIPMDEALVLTALDISGRGYLGWALKIPTEKCGDFDTELIEEFFMALTREARITLHIHYLTGKNSHHIIECTFQSFARTFREAVAIDPELAGELPSTKGTL